MRHAPNQLHASKYTFTECLCVSVLGGRGAQESWRGKQSIDVKLPTTKPTDSLFLVPSRQVVVWL